MSGADPTRRDFLSILGATSLVGFSGCSESSPDSSPTSTLKPTEVATVTNSPTPSPTPVDDVAPSILSHEAAPEDFGTRLRVSLQGEDNQNIAYAAISYGDRVIEEEPGRPEVELSGVLEDVPDAEPTFPGMVFYVLRDATGNETEKTAFADETAPTISVESRTPESAGDLELVIEGEDNVGLHQLRATLNGETVLTQDLTGSKQLSARETVSSDGYKSVTPGEMNTVGADLEDAMGNTTRKLVDQYVRKFDVLEDTRVRFGTVYQPYHGFETKIPDNCLEGRIPTVGQYNRPISYDIFNRHIDQMTGHGINRIMIEFLGNETGFHDQRFLESGLIDSVEVEPFYTAAANLWREGYHSTVDSYKNELVKPHMEFMRDNILSRDNVTKLKGRPVLQIWNPNIWSWDYAHGRIMDEYGSYSSFVQDIRAHLRIDNTDPFIVSGANWLGKTGYNERQVRLHTEFDAITTWVGGAAWGEDGQITQDAALDWIESNWKGHIDFIETHDMEFVPMVFPGFNEMNASGEKCGDQPGRRTPRSPEFFAQLIHLADEYRTTPLINNSVYNNWIEATHIEPGIFKPGPFGEENYGTAYLDVVKEFQRTNTT